MGCDEESWYKKCLVRSNHPRNFSFLKKLLAPKDQSILEAISSELSAAVNQWADGLDLGLKAI